MAGPYRRVPGEEAKGGDASASSYGGGGPLQSPSSVNSGAGEAGGGEEPSRTPAERLLDKAYAFVWVVAAVVVAKVSNTPNVLLSDERVNRPLLHAALVLMGINTLLLLYLAIYLPRIKDIKDSSAWDVYCPRVVPSMTLFGVVAAILLVRCTWPVWGFLAPLILGTEFLGALFSLHFIPWLP